MNEDWPYPDSDETIEDAFAYWGQSCHDCDDEPLGDLMPVDMRRQRGRAIAFSKARKGK